MFRVAPGTRVYLFLLQLDQSSGVLLFRNRFYCCWLYLLLKKRNRPSPAKVVHEQRRVTSQTLSKCDDVCYTMSSKKLRHICLSPRSADQRSCGHAIHRLVITACILEAMVWRFSTGTSGSRGIQMPRYGDIYHGLTRSLKHSLSHARILTRHLEGYDCCRI